MTTSPLPLPWQVRCVRDGAGGVYFSKPAGWDLLACESANYPDWEEPPCRCLGDVGISVDQANEILDEVCRMGEDKVTYGSTVGGIDFADEKLPFKLNLSLHLPSPLCILADRPFQEALWRHEPGGHLPRKQVLLHGKGGQRSR